VAALAPLFHPDMVITGADLAPRAVGREACLASYADFLAHATVVAYHEAAHAASIYGDTAVGSFRWEMSWDGQGQSRATTERGRDLWVFHRSGGAWQAVFRSMLPDAA
jgi:hypothetical protein